MLCQTRISQEYYHELVSKVSLAICKILRNSAPRRTRSQLYVRNALKFWENLDHHTNLSDLSLHDQFYYVN